MYLSSIIVANLTLRSSPFTQLALGWALPQMSDPYLLHQTLLGYKSQINCISFSPTGEFLATGSEDGLLRAWNTLDGKELAFLEADSSITCIEWHPVRRKRLFFGCSGGSVMFADNFGKVRPMTNVLPLPIIVFMTSSPGNCPANSDRNQRGDCRCFFYR
jgi:WD40 repeat protein